MHFKHLLIITGLADKDLYLVKRYREAALLIYINGVWTDAVFLCCPHQFQRQIQTQLVFGKRPCICIGMSQDNTIDHGRVFYSSSGNRLDHTVAGHVDILSVVENTAVCGLFLYIDSNSRWCDYIYIDLVNERNIFNGPMMVLQSHHKRVFSQVSALDKGLNLFLAVFCVSVNCGALKIEQHEDQNCGNRQCRNKHDKDSPQRKQPAKRPHCSADRLGAFDPHSASADHTGFTRMDLRTRFGKRPCTRICPVHVQGISRASVHSAHTRIYYSIFLQGRRFFHDTVFPLSF